MGDIYNDLMKTINSLPKDPLAGRIFLIPAERLTREVQVVEMDEKGEEITVIKTESYLVALPAFRRIETELKQSGVNYYLSEYAPQKDKDGNLCVYTMPKLNLSDYSFNFDAL